MRRRRCGRRWACSSTPSSRTRACQTWATANDLLYIAAAIAPGLFNDVTIGNNVSSFVYGGSFMSDGEAITPTGFGYSAVPGYDLATGLGSPNGTLLARALTAIGHSQMSFSSSPGMLDTDGAGWTSGIDQSLMFQMMSASPLGVTLELGAGHLGFNNGASGTFAWTSRLAQQSLQDDFDPNLVRLFDKYAQGFVDQSVVEQGEASRCRSRTPRRTPSRARSAAPSALPIS